MELGDRVMFGIIFPLTLYLGGFFAKKLLLF